MVIRRRPDVIDRAIVVIVDPAVPVVTPAVIVIVRAIVVRESGPRSARRIAYGCNGPAAGRDGRVIDIRAADACGKCGGRYEET